MAPKQIFSGQFTPLSEAVRTQSQATALAARPGPSDDLWVFAYGSLMWQPGFPHDQVEPARLDGWHRAMSVWTVLARGTPACPGLSLGLMPGGSCDGLALRIAESAVQAALSTLWQREMWTDVYRPTWLPVTVGDQEIAALTFTTNLESEQFAGTLAPPEIVEHIAAATGERGPCRDYLIQSVEKLQAHKIRDHDLEALLDAVTAFDAAPKSDCSTASR